ncbi:erythromycin esterase family protein, partial [Chitinophaga sp.]|uniref:erythromycin esterase family protein n=1 Tax=Chitinophaga sp. TaxID=1869181 RepID=UPI002BDFC723
FMHTIRLHWIEKILIAAVINTFAWCSSTAQGNGKILFSEPGSLSLDSSTAWVQSVFNKSIDNDVQVVGLGEVSHGGYEPLALKAKMAQYLIENRGYRNILLEFPDIVSVRPVRQYLLNNNIKELAVADSLAKVTATGLPNTQEVFSRLFRWIKIYNLAHPREMVKVTGFDLSMDAGFRNFFLYNYIIPFDPASGQRLLYHWNNNQVTDASRIASVNTWFNTNKSKLGKGMKKDELDELQYHLQNETHSMQYNALKTVTSAGNETRANKYRDSIMAVNAIHLAGSQKTIIWAHNGHISTIDGYMGKYLKERYRSHYFMLLTDFSNEADVYVVTGEKAVPGSRVIREKHFTAERTTIASNLLKNYGIPGGIFFDQDLPASKTYDKLNLIDIYGNQLIMPSNQAFDVLVIFNNITPYPKPVNSR